MGSIKVEENKNIKDIEMNSEKGMMIEMSKLIEKLSNKIEDIENHYKEINISGKIEDTMRRIDRMIGKRFNEIQDAINMFKGYEKIEKEIERMNKMMSNFKFKDKSVEPKNFQVNEKTVEPNNFTMTEESVEHENFKLNGKSVEPNNFIDKESVEPKNFKMNGESIEPTIFKRALWD